MQFTALSAALFVAAVSATGAEILAGGSQSPPPTYTTPSTPVPTYATVVTVGNTTSVAPLSYTTTPAPVPVDNGTTMIPAATGNLSTTIGHKGSVSQSVFITTISGPNGPSTKTSIVFATATGGAPGSPSGAGASGSATPTVQGGVGAHVRVEAGAALALLAGVGAFFL